MPALVTPAPAFLFAALFVIPFLWACMAVGRRLLILLNVPAVDEPSERAVLTAALGAGLLQFLPFLLGVFGVLSVVTMRVALLAIVLVFVKDVLAVGRAGVAAVKRLPQLPKPLLWLCVALSPGLVAAALLALTPTIDPDGLAYHLTVPKRWLALGTLEYLPTYVYSNTPMGVEMLFTAGLAVTGDSAAKLLHLALGVLAAVAVYRAGVRLKGHAVGAFAAFLFLAGPTGVSYLLGWAYVEGAIGFVIAAAALAWLLWFQDQQAGRLRCVALLAGVAVSFKLTTVLFVVGLAALTGYALVLAARERKEPPRAGLLRLASLVPFVVLPVLPWFVRSTLVTGNPVFPLFAKLIPSRDFSPELAASFDNYNRYLLWASRFATTWSIEFRKIVLSCCMAAVALCGVLAFVRFKSPIARATTIILSLVMIGQLSAVGLYARYWVPVLPVLLLPVLAGLYFLLAAAWAQRALIVVAALGSLLQARTALKSVDFDLAPLSKTALGLMSPVEFARSKLVLYPIYDAANQSLPANARVALTYNCSSFYIDKTTFCSDFPQDALGFANWEAFNASIRALRVTHVVAPRTIAEGGPPPPPDYSAPAQLFRARENEYVGRLLQSRGRLLVAAADQGLYALEPEAAPALSPPPPRP